MKSLGQAGGAQPVALHAPGNATVVGARRTVYNGVEASADYSIMFSPCLEVWVEFGHVRSIVPALLTKLPPFDQGCNTYSPAPGALVSACWTAAADVKVSAGETIGTTVGLDLTMFDARVPAIQYANNARWGGITTGFDHFHVVPFSDYSPSRCAPRSRGASDRSTERAGAPSHRLAARSHQTSREPRRAPGSSGTSRRIRSRRISRSTRPTWTRRSSISMGTSGGPLTPGLRRMVPSSGGPFNLHPAQITPGTAVHGWDLSYQYDQGSPGIALLQPVHATTLRIEGRLGVATSCATTVQPFALTDLSALTPPHGA